jgi:hypothetical protein
MEFTMESLETLADQLSRISQARKLNALLRAKLHHRLSVIDAEIYLRDHPLSANPSSVFYDQPSIHGISDSEQQNLIQLFWGKKNIDRVEDHDPPRSSSDLPISAVAQRKLFLNSTRDARQRWLATSGGRHKVLLGRLNLLVHDNHFMLIDAVRYFMMIHIFRESISLPTIYPNMNFAKMRLFLTRVSDPQKVASEHALADFGVDVDEMQNRISSVLRQLRMEPADPE